MTETISDLRERVLVLAPSGRDGPLVAATLQRVGLASLVCAGITELCAEIDGGAALAVLADEAVAGRALGLLRETLNRQPLWSDLPIVMFTGRRSEVKPGLVNEAADALGNVTTLERPIHPITLVNA